MNRQPVLVGKTIRVRPLLESDFDELLAAASDPLIWEQHPDRERYGRERFSVYFRSGIESGGALAVLDIKSGKIIGSSRFTDFDPAKSLVAVGFTFLTRDNWGGSRNLELKTLMLDHAFQFVETVVFVVGEKNFRSRRALEKIGAVSVTDFQSTKPHEVVFKIMQSDWARQEFRREFAHPLEFKRVTEADVEILAEFGRETYHDTFAEHNTPEDMAAYLGEAFAREKQLREIQDPNRIIEIAWIDGEPAGYFQLVHGNPDLSVKGPRPIEIMRLYAGKKWHGRGVGAALMERALELGRQNGFETAWLGVWEKNFRALAFYAKQGFVRVGEHGFQLGSDLQTDFILARTTARPN